MKNQAWINTYGDKSWADMTDPERVAHSLWFGTDWAKGLGPNVWDQAYQGSSNGVSRNEFVEGQGLLSALNASPQQPAPQNPQQQDPSRFTGYLDGGWFVDPQTGDMMHEDGRFTPASSAQPSNGLTTGGAYNMDNLPQTSGGLPIQPGTQSGAPRQPIGSTQGQPVDSRRYFFDQYQKAKNGNGDSLVMSILSQ